MKTFYRRQQRTKAKNEEAENCKRLLPTHPWKKRQKAKEHETQMTRQPDHIEQEIEQLMDDAAQKGTNNRNQDTVAPEKKRERTCDEELMRRKMTARQHGTVGAIFANHGKKQWTQARRKTYDDAGATNTRHIRKSQEGEILRRRADRPRSTMPNKTKRANKRN